MKLKCYTNGVLKKEEILPNGWVSRVSYINSDIVNIDLSDFTSTYEKTIEIGEDSKLKLIVNDAPFLESIYDIMDLHKGIEIVRFECDESLIIVEW